MDNYSHTFEQLLDFVGEDATGKDIFEKTIIDFVDELRKRDIRPASINHYLRGIRAFLYWCMDSDYVQSFKIMLMREQEPVKETYTPEELQVLLREPKAKASYVEWRSWAVINWMLDNGNRAQTVCSVRMMDFSLEDQQVTLSHTKNRKAQILPISDDLATVLRKFIRMFRSDAKEDEYLFPNVGGDQMTPNGLKLSIRKYNLSRGVEKTGVHMFRHTFAKMMVMNDCNAFRLQKMLGHSTLEMTRRYVNLYGQDLKENHERYSPLHKMKQGNGMKHNIKRKK